MPVSPPRPKGLPLNALRAFEAAARLGGFAAAAEELGVTPGAVAAHVKALEAEVGAPLFVRHARGVRPSALSARLLPEFSEALDRLGLAVQALRSEAAPGVVHVATLPAIAQLWLAPRMPALRAALPGDAISITALEAPPNLKRVPFDLTLFYEPEGRGGVSRPVARNAVFPVCAPDIAAGLSSPADLADASCLIDSAWSADWSDWAALAMPGAAFTPRGPTFSLFALALEEAIAGSGVLMAQEALVAPALADGRLVAPFPQVLERPRPLTLRSLRALPPSGAAARVAQLLSDATERR